MVILNSFWARSADAGAQLLLEIIFTRTEVLGAAGLLFAALLVSVEASPLGALCLCEPGQTGNRAAPACSWCALKIRCGAGFKD